MVSVYNLLNANPVLSYSNRYGPVVAGSAGHPDRAIRQTLACRWISECDRSNQLFCSLRWWPIVARTVFPGPSSPSPVPSTGTTISATAYLDALLEVMRA